MKKLSIFLAFLLFVGFQAAAQMQISGTVTSSDDGSSIPGVSVMVKGNTSIGTTTDIDGKYTLTVPSDAKTLVFSFVGMKAQEVAINNQSVIDVVMESDVLKMDEVVVVGYGTTTKQSFTGSAAKVDAEKLDVKNVSNVTTALEGEVAGVQVINDNGQPGSTAKIRIRGIGSVNGSREPLYIVDGVPLEGDINSIAPSDIASMTVLKDASATAIYGSRGANGVVIITTKSGNKGEGVVEVDVKYGNNMKLWPGYDVIESPEKFVETSWSALKTRGLLLGNSEADAATFASQSVFDGVLGLDPNYNMWDVSGDQLIDPATGKFNSGVNRRYSPEKWSDVLFQSAKRTQASLRFSGGSDNSTYFSSFNYLKDEGYYLNSDYDRLTGRINMKTDVKSWLKANVNTSFMRSESNYGGGQDEDSNNGFWLVDNMPPVYPVYGRDANGDKVKDEILGGYVFDYGDGTFGTRRFANLTNAAASSTYDIVRQINNQFTGRAGLKATFLKNFTLSSDFGMEYLITNYDELGNMFYGGSQQQGGSIYKNRHQYLAYTTTNMLKWAQAFGDHNFTAFVAQEASSYENHRLTAFKSRLADPFGTELNNAVVSSPSNSYTIANTLESYFGQIQYDYKSTYFLQFVIRRDGSSRFINDKWGTFGSIGGAWVLTNESFMSSLSMINNLKLKTSYGIIGNQNGIDSYSGYDLYTIDNLNDQLAFSFDTKGNPDLTWEQARQLQVGLELGLYNDRVTASVDYYYKTTTNLLYPKKIASSAGYSSILVNDGAMLNSGVEFNINSDIYKTQDLTVSLNLNGAFQHNELTEMPIDNSTGLEKVLDVDGIYGRAAGRSLFDIYTREYAGVDPQTGAAQWYRYYNTLSDGTKDYFTDWATYMDKNKGNIGTIGKEKTETLSEATYKWIDKSPIPIVRGSFDLNVKYKGFAVTALFAYSIGGYGMDWNYLDLMNDDRIGGNNWSTDIANAWKKPGDVTDVPAITGGLTSTGINYSNANASSDRFVTKTDYLALNNIRISYDFSKQMTEKLHLKGLRIYASGDNLWVNTARHGYYPNLSEVGASARYQYVALTTFTAGVNLKF